VFHYTLVVPDSSRLSIDSHAASIDLSGATRSTVIDTYSGPVRGSNLSGDLELDSYSGTVELAYDRLTAPLNIKSVQGSIRLILPKDAGFNLETDL
jgi:DUF4097 and DUF4098 domain-containing protein YvlB